MWAGILSRIGQMLLTYLVMPLLSKAIVWITEYFQEKAEESKRSKEIDSAIKRYKEAADGKEQEDAFKDLIRSRRS